MKTEEAKILLQKYFEAETTSEEEMRLTAWFLEGDVPEELQPFTKWFAGLGQSTLQEESAALEEEILSRIQEPDFPKSGRTGIFLNPENRSQETPAPGRTGIFSNPENRSQETPAPDSSGIFPNPVFPGKRSLWFTLTGIAASLLITFGAYRYYVQEETWQDTFDDPTEALAYAEKTLGFVSEKYNKGMSQLSAVGTLGEAARDYENSARIIEKGFSEINKIQLINNLK